MGLLGNLAALLFGRRGGGASPFQEGGRSPQDVASLNRWETAETQDVKRPRDPRTKYCFENLGQPIEIIYKRKARVIVPRRVFTKPGYEKTYVEADSDGILKTFDIDDMRVPKRARK